MNNDLNFNWKFNFNFDLKNFNFNFNLNFIFDFIFNFTFYSYDFNFDFDTPNTLVCTEVVYRCYGGNSDGATLKFPIVTLMGRRTLPAHQLAIQFPAPTRYRLTVCAQQASKEE